MGTDHANHTKCSTLSRTRLPQKHRVEADRDGESGRAESTSWTNNPSESSTRRRRCTANSKWNTLSNHSFIHSSKCSTLSRTNLPRKHRVEADRDGERGQGREYVK